MDALLSGQRALPGSAMADRFALLDANPHQRRERVKSYLEFFRVRSSVAHGGRSSRLDQGDFVRQYQDAVRWAARRALALRDEFEPSSETQVDELFDALRLGSRMWSESGVSHSDRRLQRDSEDAVRRCGSVPATLQPGATTST